MAPKELLPISNRIFLAVLIVITVSLVAWKCISADPKIYLDSNPSLTKNARPLLFKSDKFTGTLRSKHLGFYKLTAYKNGIRHGKVRAFFENGNRKMSGQHANGKKTGRFRTWWANGQLQKKVQFRRGTYDGKHLSWYASGKPFEILNFRNGAQVGTQKVLKSDGRIKANYVATKGRNWGLIGVINCQQK
ncbi:MAG: hypothetical protein ACI9BD_001278 [Candidatus Marinamargulisbacteria bacterium]|jgi:hypothetical protein